MSNNKIKKIVLAEEKRPAIYTAMKYWGKKPHNIWREYIKAFSDEKGVVLDPFGGCGITAIEGLKANRKVIVTDINPLMTFLLDVYSTKFEERELAKYADEIVNDIENDEIYNFYFKINYNKKIYTIQNFKWEKSKIYQIGLINKKEKINICNCDDENNKIKSFNKIPISKWIPNAKLSKMIEVDNAFIKAIGDDNINAIWTRRNLYVLSLIFDKINKIKFRDLRLQLLFAFIQSLHLTSKMCIPRREQSKRDFSTSWGRPAYICSNRQMEMNPLLVFRNNCTGKQSASSSLKSFSEYFDIPLFFNCINHNGINSKSNINYGIYDAKKLNSLVKKQSVDLIITDPPYGGMIHYCDLSYVWNCWLEKYDKKYKTDFKNEVVIKEKSKNRNKYLNDLTLCISNFYKILKRDGKLIITFNSKDIDLWATFIKSIIDGGFYINQVSHQQNLRSSEANVYDLSGTSGTDYYLICSKTGNNTKASSLTYERFIDDICNVIKLRNENTPISVLIDYYINKIIKNEIKCPDFNISKELTKIKNENIYYNKKNKCLCLTKYSSKQNLSDKIKNYVLKNQSKSSYQEVEVAIYKKFSDELRPEKATIKKIYNEVFNEKKY